MALFLLGVENGRPSDTSVITDVQPAPNPNPTFRVSLQPSCLVDLEGLQRAANFKPVSGNQKWTASEDRTRKQLCS